MKHCIKSPQWYVSTSAYETELSPWRPCPFHSHEYADRWAFSPGHWKEDAVSLESHKRMDTYAKDTAWLWHKKWSSVTWTCVYSLVKLIETDMMKLSSICPHLQYIAWYVRQLSQCGSKLFWHICTSIFQYCILYDSRYVWSQMLWLWFALPLCQIRGCVC